jgi:glycolate oxidase FAD binding subunit
VDVWAGIVGAEFARAGTATDAVDGIVPVSVVRPASVDEVQSVVRAAASSGSALVATGLGGHLDIGAPPRRVDVLVRLDRLDGVRDHQPADMTVTTEAGCSLARLDALLTTAGQWLPLDPPRPEATTAGGLVAANLAGPLRASQGTVRDLLLGLRVVGADAALVASGGRVVKNVAGYDLSKLHVGALGTVGVIVEATFKVRPRPAREEAVVIACRSAREAGDTALAVRDAVEALWLEAAGSHALPDGPGAAAAVVVGIGGCPEEVLAVSARVRQVAATLGLTALAVEGGARLRIRLGTFGVEPAAAVLRVGTLPTEVGTVMEAAEVAARAAGSDVRCLAHAANGVVRVAVADARAIGAVLAALRAAVAGHGGSAVVERATAAAKTGLDVWGVDGPSLGLMRRMKDTFDPSGVLAPGRFVGGI